MLRNTERKFDLVTDEGKEFQRREPVNTILGSVNKSDIKMAITRLASGVSVKRVGESEIIIKRWR